MNNTLAEDTFLAVINVADNPADATLVKRVYADWLDEMGDRRAELVRLHIELEGMADPRQHNHWETYCGWLSRIYGSNDLDKLIVLLDTRHQRLLACRYAEEVLGYYEQQFPDDKRPRECITIARKYAMGAASKQELAAARDAAWAAARDAAGSTAWPAAGAAARTAARDAAGAAAGVAVRATTCTVTKSQQLVICTSYLLGFFINR